MILPKLKEITNILNFAKKSFTKGGFRHVGNYINGLITITKKTVNKIAQYSETKYQSSLNRMLNEAKFDKEQLEKRYLKKMEHMFRGAKINLLFDDTLVERNGKHVEASQSHHDHNKGGYTRGHQFFTAIVCSDFLQLPIFPELYSKNTDSKIEMANSLVEKLNSASIKIDNVLFDSWYSDKDLIKKCVSIGATVICAIKINRTICIEGSNQYKKLSYVSETIAKRGQVEYNIDNQQYHVWERNVRLKKMPLVKMLISRITIKDKQSKIHLISSNANDSVENIIRTYKIRWKIEVFHRDIKQNLGFSKVFLRKKEGIVRHAIFVSLAFAILGLIMFRKNISGSIGEFCEQVKNKSVMEVMKKIVDMENKGDRIAIFNEVFEKDSFV